MSHRRFPSYPDDADYTTNAPSYYEDLARKQGLLKELAERIWGYEATLNLSLEQIAQRFTEWDGKIAGFDGDVNVLLQKWISDGTFDHIINDTIFEWKADKVDLEAAKEDIALSLSTKRDKAILISETDISDTLKQQITGTTSINAVPAKGSLLTERVAPKGFNENAMSFIKHGKNYFNKDTVLNDYQLNTGTGELTSWVGRSTSDYINLNRLIPFIYSGFTRAWSFYDTNYAFISGGLTNFTDSKLVIPVNAVFYRFTVDTIEIGGVQLEEGVVRTAYEPYKLLLAQSDYSDDITTNKNVIDGLTTGLGTPLNIGKTEKNIGEFTGHRSYSELFLKWAYEFKKVNFTKTITRVEAYINIGANLDKPITLIVLSADRTTELYSITQTFSSSGKIQFNVNIPLSLLPNTFYIGYKTDGTHGIMPANATIDAGYTTGGTYYYTNSWNLASGGYPTDIKVYTGYDTTLKPHTHAASDITGLSVALNKVMLSLPDKYEVVVGNKFELFYKGIILANNPYNYNFKVVSTKGYAFKRKYEYTPVIGDVGTHVLTVSIYDDNDVLLDTKNVNLIVKGKAVNPASIKNVLMVGDSLTSGGDWVTEVHRKIVTVDGLSNVKFIGTVGTTPKYEGYGGWTIERYLSNENTGAVIWIVGTHDKDITDQHAIFKDGNNVQWKLETIEAGKIKVIRVSGSTAIPASGTLTWVSGGTHTSNIVYTSTIAESNNPFWNEVTSQVDFANYATELGVTSIDHCYVLLGWNSTMTTEATYKSSVRVFINELRSDFASSKITLVGLQVADIDGLGMNYGASWNFKDTLKFVFELNRWLKEVAAEYVGVDFVNLSGQFDTEYNMPFSNTSVNARNTTTERRGINGVHPALEGYMQIADAVYRNITHKI